MSREPTWIVTPFDPYFFGRESPPEIKGVFLIDAGSVYMTPNETWVRKPGEMHWRENVDEPQNENYNIPLS